MFSGRSRKRKNETAELGVKSIKEALSQSVFREEDRMMTFDGDDKDLYDIILVVEGRKFYCSKIILSKHSPTFKSMFFGNFEEQNQDEIELKEVSILEFQNFLEIIHGAIDVTDETLNGLLKLSRMWLASIPLKKCRDFLESSSKKDIKERYDLAVEYDFEDIKREIITTIRSPLQLHKLIPEDVSTFDPPTMALILKKSLEFTGFKNLKKSSICLCGLQVDRSSSESSIYNNAVFGASPQYMYHQHSPHGSF